MTTEFDIYKSIAEREKASRAEAERLLEQKSRDLYAKNSEIERKAQELKAANKLLSEIMSAAPDGILLCSEGFDILDINSTCEQKLGCTKNEIIGGGLDDFFPGASDQLARFEAGELQVDLINARRRDDSTFPVELRGTVGAIADKARYLLFFHDISNRLKAQEHRQQIEQQVDEARRLEAIGALSAGIAHEINTPIQFIGDNLEYFMEAFANIHESYSRYDRLKVAAVADGAYQEHIDSINEFNQSIDLQTLIKEVSAALIESRDGIRQVRDIVLLMKEFAHPGTGAKEEADLNRIIRNVATLSRNRQKNVADIEFILPDDLPPVTCRRGQIQQVILNIFMNALDAIDEEGVEHGRVRIATTNDENSVFLTISDNGPGVPESLKQKIFDPFFTTKPVGKGTGQGLALAKECIVNGHGGKLSLIDVEGFSTTFLIQLPRRPELSPINMEYQNVVAAE